MKNGAKPEKKPTAKTKRGKFHYDPVGMSGKEAGIIEEVEERETNEDAAPARRTEPTRPGRKEGGRKQKH